MSFSNAFDMPYIIKHDLAVITELHILLMMMKYGCS